MSGNRFAYLSVTSLTAVAFAITGCGGSSNGSTHPTVAQGEYIGVYRSGTSSGAASSAAGQAQFSISNGEVGLTLSPLSSSLLSYDGTISGNKATLTAVSGGTTSTSTSVSGDGASGDTITLTFSQNSGTQALTASYTASDGTDGEISAGALVGVLLPLPQGYSGTYNTASGVFGTLSVTIDSGNVTGTGTSSTGATFPIDGSLDSAGVLYLAYDDGAGYENSVSTAVSGNLGTSANYTLRESPSGQTLHIALAPGAPAGTDRRVGSIRGK